MLLIMRCKRTFEVRGQAASLRGGRTSSVRARGRGSRAQPSRGMDRLIERIFLDRLNEVAEDVVRSIGMRRKRDLAEPHKVSFDGGVWSEPRMFLPITGERGTVYSRDSLENSTWRGPRAPGGRPPRLEGIG